MTVAVIDANIFIDLIKLDLIKYLFNFNLTIHTTREVFDQLHQHQQDILMSFVNSNNLHIYDFTSDEILDIYKLDMPRGLETADRSVFYYANRHNMAVLSGDNKLRKFCQSQNLEVKGILWVPDNMVKMNLFNERHGRDRLKKLMSYNDRLPQEECLKMLKVWGD